MNTVKFPSVHEAEEILQWASDKNPGPWVDHSKMVAKAARTIASNCRLDHDKAYVLGLLHDIGRYEGVTGLHHTIAGYNFMSSKQYNDVAKICLTHSFPMANIAEFCGGVDCSEEEIVIIKDVLEHQPYDDYDRLIQLCDAIALPIGVTTMDARLLDVTRRHGFNDYTLRKWESIFALKRKFDDLCETNIYNFFLDDIMASIMLS